MRRFEKITQNHFLFQVYSRERRNKRYKSFFIFWIQTFVRTLTNVNILNQRDDKSYEKKTAQFEHFHSGLPDRKFTNRIFVLINSENSEDSYLTFKYIYHLLFVIKRFFVPSTEGRIIWNKMSLSAGTFCLHLRSKVKRTSIIDRKKKSPRLVEKLRFNQSDFFKLEIQLIRGFRYRAWGGGCGYGYSIVSTLRYTHTQLYCFSCYREKNQSQMFSYFRFHSKSIFIFSFVMANKLATSPGQRQANALIQSEL
jgi:hypothetical protein